MDVSDVLSLLRDRSPDLTVIDGCRPFAEVLQAVADAERRSQPGGLIAVVGIEPHAEEETAATDGGARLLVCLRRHRPDLGLWALGRGEAPPSGLLAIAGLDPENRTLEQEFDGIVADAGHPAPSPLAMDDPARTTVEALLAALPVQRDAPDVGAALSTTPVEPAWRQAEQRCIRAYYEDRLAEGLRACDAVLSSADSPPEVRAQTLCNLTYYAPTLRSLVQSFTHARIDFALPPGWFATNPSIARDVDGWLAVVRTIDFEFSGPYTFRQNDPKGRRNTVNYLIRLDDDLHLVAAYPIVDATLLEPRRACRYAGLEDCRLVRWRNDWVASCGSVDRTPTCSGMIDLVHLDAATGSFHSAVPLSDRNSLRWEKNWMPVVAGDDLFFVYGCYPTIVLRFDPVRAAVVPHRQHPSPPIAREIKGGSQGLRVPGGWLFCVHQSADFRDRARMYLHRFMLLDDDFRLTHLSRPFTFLGPGVEFCAGLAQHGENVVLSFGVEDREAHIVQTSLAEVLTLLDPVAPVTEPAQTDPAPPPAISLRDHDDPFVEIETALRISDDLWHVQGWTRADPFAPLLAALVRPDGSAMGLEDQPDWLPRGRDDRGRLPFSAAISLPPATPPETDGVVLRLTVPFGAGGTAPLPPLVTDDRAILDALGSEIDLDRPGASWRRMAFLHESIAPVNARLVSSASVVHTEDLGAMPEQPTASLVVTLHRNLDFLEHQLATFAADPDSATWEVLMLLDGPEVADAFLPLVRSAAARTGVPVKAMVTNHNAGFSTANNLAAQYARAPYVVLQNSDAFPAAPGWVAAMIAKHRSDPSIGAIGPKLIYPDGLVQSTGHVYERLPDLPGWNWRSRHWGIPRDDPAVQVDTPVRGLCGASVFLPAEIFRRAGGFPNCYLKGQFEDCELSDRVRELGHQLWYLASVEMIHAEAQTYHGQIRRREWLYNAWLYARRQGDFLAAGR